MDLFEHPSKELWIQREEWLDKLIEESEVGSYLVSDQSTALFMDLRRAYCAGAWLSVVVMSVSILDAHLRETEAMDNKIGTAKLFNEYYAGENADINWLRILRNKYVHLDIDQPALTIDKWYDNQIEMENNAVRAIHICVKAFFQSPGT